MSLVRKTASALLAWLYGPKNRLMRDPVYAKLTREIEAARNDHRNAKALRDRRQHRLHALLAGGVRPQAERMSHPRALIGANHMGEPT